MRRLAQVIAAGLLALSMAGCAGTHTSDLPWNTPQSWEGSPSLPGMSGSGRP